MSAADTTPSLLQMCSFRPSWFMSAALSLSSPVRTATARRLVQSALKLSFPISDATCPPVSSVMVYKEFAEKLAAVKEAFLKETGAPAASLQELESFVASKIVKPRTRGLRSLKGFAF